jgi:anti-anti-sigma factor
VLVPGLPNAFAITESVEPDGVRLNLSGELDVAVVGDLQNRLDSVGRAGELVVLDLSELTFIDSSGLNVLITAARRARSEGWQLRIERSMTRPVQRVVTMMGLSAVFWPESDPVDIQQPQP